MMNDWISSEGFDRRLSSIPDVFMCFEEKRKFLAKKVEKSELSCGGF